jgi:hypothetical protein
MPQSKRNVGEGVEEERRYCTEYGVAEKVLEEGGGGKGWRVEGPRRSSTVLRTKTQEGSTE